MVVVLSVSNGVSAENLTNLQIFIQEFLKADPEEFYIRQLERQATDAMSSGMGFLTIKNDYPAELGWQFCTADQQPDAVTVTTMVHLTV